MEEKITALVSTTSGAHPWWITGVYGPQDDDEKILFLEDLQDTRDSCAGPWLLGGDFNLVSSSSDKSNGRINRRTSNRFRRFIADMELRDVYMHGRRYTWSNERDSPTLVRNDRFLCTSEWDLAQPHAILRCLASTVSDHCPLFLDCTPRSAGPRRFHFERFGIKLEGFQETVAAAWGSVHAPDPFRRVYLCLKITARRLQSWLMRPRTFGLSPPLRSGFGSI